jgi:hypothetical protein
MTNTEAQNIANDLGSLLGPTLGPIGQGPAPMARWAEGAFYSDLVATRDVLQGHLITIAETAMDDKSRTFLLTQYGAELEEVHNGLLAF